MVDNRNIRHRCTGRKGLRLNFSETIQLAKNFANFMKKVLKYERMFRHQELDTRACTFFDFFSDVAFERSKTTAILSDAVNLRIQSEYRKIQTRKNSVFGHFSRSVM